MARVTRRTRARPRGAKRPNPPTPRPAVTMNTSTRATIRATSTAPRRYTGTTRRI